MLVTFLGETGGPLLTNGSDFFFDMGFLIRREAKIGKTSSFIFQQVPAEDDAAGKHFFLLRIGEACEACYGMKAGGFNQILEVVQQDVVLLVQAASQN